MIDDLIELALSVALITICCLWLDGCVYGAEIGTLPEIGGGTTQTERREQAARDSEQEQADWRRDYQQANDEYDLLILEQRLDAIEGGSLDDGDEEE